jgi:hypothetical protein
MTRIVRVGNYAPRGVPSRHNNDNVARESEVVEVLEKEQLLSPLYRRMSIQWSVLAEAEVENANVGKGPYNRLKRWNKRLVVDICRPGGDIHIDEGATRGWFSDTGREVGITEDYPRSDKCAVITNCRPRTVGTHEGAPTESAEKGVSRRHAGVDNCHAWHGGRVARVCRAARQCWRSPATRRPRAHHRNRSL